MTPPPATSRSKRSPIAPPFSAWPREGQPYLARTNVLRRRLLRMLGTRDKPSRLLNLRGTIERLEYRLTGSRLEAQFVLWQLARVHLGKEYRREIRLRLPPYVKLVLSNRLSAHAGHDANWTRPRRLLRPIPQSRHGRAFRIRFPRPLPVAPLSGRPRAPPRPSRLHVRRNGPLPASLPASGRH
jgi:hypothetical protein